MGIPINKPPGVRRPLSEPRVALVHYWHLKRRGGERVFEVLADMFPRADIFMLLCDNASLSPKLAGRNITVSFLNRLPFAKKNHRLLLPLFPYALEQFDLSNYDLVISQESGPAKGVLTRADALHICYCHTPMRYLWDMYHHYCAEAPFGSFGRFFFALSSHSVRKWDALSSSRVDHFVASSRNSAGRIRKYYGRDSRVLYPPVDLQRFRPAQQPSADFYLVVSPLVSYKRVDLAIRACNELRRPLVIIGAGEREAELRRIAGPTVKFLGFQADENVAEHLRNCRAFLFPGEEDIGLAPIEAQASGRPVIAYARGGALETVLGMYPGEKSPAAQRTGIFFHQQNCEALCEAILAFEALQGEFSSSFIHAHAQRFDEHHFRRDFAAFVASCQTRIPANAKRRTSVSAD